MIGYWNIRPMKKGRHGPSFSKLFHTRDRFRWAIDDHFFIRMFGWNFAISIRREVDQ